MDWVIALIGTLSGTILGWALQFIRKRKLYINKFEIQPKNDNGIANAYFKLSVYNSSHFTKAIKNPRIVCYYNKEEILTEQVQRSALYNNRDEKEQAERYRNDIELIEILPHGNIAQLCKIEFFDFNCTVNDAYLVYEDEKFKTRKLKIQWKNKEKNYGKIENAE